MNTSNSRIQTLGFLLENINEELFSNREEELERRVEEIALINGYEQQRQLISEGLLRSFPEEMLCKRIASAYSGKVKNLQFVAIDKFDNDLPCVGIATDAKSNPKMFENLIKRELGVTGWFISEPPSFQQFEFDNETDRDNPLSKYGFCNNPGTQRAYIMWVKARFPISGDNVQAFTKKVLDSTPIFYHVSLERLNARIQLASGGGGLVPQESTKGAFLYPERNYVFGTKEAMIDWLNDVLGVNFRKTATNNLRRIGNEVQKNKGDRNRAPVADEQYQNLADWPITIYTVDLNRLVADGHPLRLYRDNNWPKSVSAYFTPDPIPQQYLNDVTKTVMAPFVNSKPFVLRTQKRVFDENRP